MNDIKPPKPATAKLNYFAWLSWNRKSFKFGATDLLVMNQLIVRCDVGGGFAMLIATLARRTRAAPSTVRRSVTRLAKAGFIEVTHRQGRSSLFRVCFEKAKPNWIAIQSERDRRKREGRAQGAKVSAHTPPKAGRTSRQEVSYNSISSDHRSSHIFKRPSGRFVEDAIAQGNFESGDTEPDEENRTPLQRNNRPVRPQAACAARDVDPDADPEFDPFHDAFAEFLKLWPRQDRNELKLRAAWRNHVVMRGVDPATVLAAARRVKKHYRSKGGSPPFAGAWLAKRGWERWRTNNPKPEGDFEVLNRLLDQHTRGGR